MINCARKGTPSGGPKDINPPVLLKASPKEFSTNVPRDLDEIILHFDEYVLLKNYLEQVIISPPMNPSPIFSPAGTAAKEVSIFLNDSLKQNTTYLINFGQSIQDNNEGNSLDFFTYVFSTGNDIDSLEVVGKVNTLGQRENPDNIVVGLYKEVDSFNDSIYFTQKPFYVTKVDSAGNYKLPYLADDKYRIIAYQDDTPDLTWDKRTESVAFVDSIIRPGENNTINLTLFKPEIEYAVQSTSQKDYGRIDFYFTGQPKEISIRPVDSNIELLKTVHKAYSDTASVYFNPVLIQTKDKTLRQDFIVKYNSKIDTIQNVAYDLETKENFKVYFKKLEYNPSNALKLEANQPIVSIDSSRIEVLQDSISLNFTVKSIKDNLYQLNFPIDYESRYIVKALPGAVESLYGNTNDTINYSFLTKSEQEYGSLKLSLVNKPTQPIWIKLLTEKGNVIKTEYSEEKDSFMFKDLIPGKYYISLSIDENSDGRLNTGDVFQKKQPEPVLLYPAAIEVKAFWEITEQWILPKR